MGIEMRHLDRIKEKVVIRLDNRQIGWLVGFGLVISGGVFTAGYVVGQNAHPAPRDEANTPALDASKSTEAPKKGQAVASAEASIPAETSAEPAAPHYTYDHVLTAPTPPVQIDDPALRILAEARRAGGDLDLAGPRPADPDTRAPRADASDTPAGVPPHEIEASANSAVNEMELALKADLAPAIALARQPATKAGLRGAKAAAPAKRIAPINGARPPAGFTIQVKAFRHKKEARQFIAVMRDAGYRPYLLSAEVPGKGRFFRVRLGKFKTMKQAHARQAAFEKAEGFKTIVTPL